MQPISEGCGAASKCWMRQLGKWNTPTDTATPLVNLVGWNWLASASILASHALAIGVDRAAQDRPAHIRRMRV